MITTTKSLRRSLLAFAASVSLCAMPVLSQDQPATPAGVAAPASVAADPAADPATDPAAAPADASAEAQDAQAAPEGGEPPADTRALDETVQDLKKDVVDLNRELFVLEEELLFPANTQVAVFVSMDVGTFFDVDSVQLKVDDKEVANYLYTEREQQALKRGGVQRLWLGNLKAGEHEVTAFFTGKGPHERDYKRGTTLRVEKGVGAKYVELRISDRATKLQPEFVVKVWE